jgi:hypothetical protein
MGTNCDEHCSCSCDHYNAFVDTIWKDARINCERSTCWSQRTHLRYQLEEPTSSRIVTKKQHSKYTGMWAIVLSIHSLNIPNHLTVPSVHCPESFSKTSSRDPHKKPREQYLGSLKEPLNKTKEDRWIFHLPQKSFAFAIDLCEIWSIIGYSDCIISMQDLLCTIHFAQVVESVTCILITLQDPGKKLIRIHLPSCN